MATRKSKREMIEELKQTVEEDALSFVMEKGHEGKTVVVNIETGEYYSYQLPAVNALKAAYVANMMRKIGRVNDPSLVVYFSASKEFEELDSKIEFAAKNTMLRLGSLYTYANEQGQKQLDKMMYDAQRRAKYKRYF